MRMGSRAFVVAVAIVVAVIAPAVAKEFLVGDANGWKGGVDYQKWAAGKQFYSGDILVFKYPKGKHDVIKVNEAADFEQCVAPASAQLMTSGNDYVTLKEVGEQHFICGFPDHCSKGMMKLTVKVLSDRAW